MKQPIICIITVISKRIEQSCHSLGWPKHGVSNTIAPALSDTPPPRLCLTCNFHKKSKVQGFAYVEVLVASALMAIALVPALNALQSGIQSTGIHQSLTVQRYQCLKKMAELNAEPYANLLSAAKSATNKTTASSYSDASGASNRRLVYLGLYDADADPFTLIDPNTDGDNDLYTGSTANLLWIRVETEGTAQGIETLMSR